MDNSIVIKAWEKIMDDQGQQLYKMWIKHMDNNAMEVPDATWEQLGEAEKQAWRDTAEEFMGRE